MDGKLVVVIGGSGFIGRHLVQRLARAGHRIRVCVRDTEGALFLKPLGDLGQIAFRKTDVLKTGDLDDAVAGADWVVNLVGILYESGRRTFQAMHVDAAEAIAKGAARHGAERMVQMSALGASPKAAAKYAQTKAAGEAAVLAAYPHATILRPSVVFGPQDGFFNLFATLARVMPVLPVYTQDGFMPRVFRKDGQGPIDWFGSGGPKFQPVYVGDVADAIMRVLTTGGHAGLTYELCGPRTVSMKEVMELVVEQIQRRRLIVPVPMWKASLLATLTGWLPKPIITHDQVKLLKVDNVCSGAHPGLAQLGIEPETMEAILPTYLSRFRPRHRHVVVRPERG